MVRIRPFRAIRPQPHLAARVAALPYDVINRAEAKQLAADNPLSFLHVSRSEIDLPDEVGAYEGAVYARAVENLRSLMQQGVLFQEAAPQLYLYRQVRQHRPQVGLVCCCHVGDYESGAIRRHEKTRPDKEDDRTRHTLAIAANAGPVFLAYRDLPALAPVLASDMNDRPLYHFDADDGVTHSAWLVKDARPYVEHFARVPAVYVADGHHRAASAARAARELRAANPRHSGEEAYNWFLTVLFPASELTILPYNRLVRGLKGRLPEAVRRELARAGAFVPTRNRSPGGPGRFCVYLPGGWHLLTIDLDTIDRRDPIACLDVDLLQQRVLGPVFGIEDPRTDADLDFVGGVRSPQELEREVDAGRAAAAFVLHPTTIEQLLTVADAGLVMPPKSTWFEPKLRSGLFVHSLK